MSRGITWAIVAVCLLACGRKQEERIPLPALHPPLEADPAIRRATGTVTFAWHKKLGSDPCRVWATQLVDKNGMTAVVTFRAALKRKVGEYLFDHEELRVDAIDGRPPTAVQSRAIEAVSSPPSLHVSWEGEYMGVGDVRRVIEMLGKAMNLSPDEVARLDTDAMRDLIQRRSGDHWLAYAGAWIGAELGGEPVEVTREGGEGKVRIEHLGMVKGRPELALMSYTRRIDDTAPGSSLLEVVEQKITAAIDPATARPYRVRNERLLRTADGTEREVRDTQFEWATAEGCDPK